MGLKTLLTDLQASTDGKTTIPGFMPQRSPTAPELETWNQITPHVVVFKNQNITWPDGGNEIFNNDQPYVRTTPPEFGKDNAYEAPGGLATLAGDFGQVDYSRGGEFGGKARAQDFMRITKFLLSPTGLSWNTREATLQLTNPRVDAPMKGLFDNFGNFGFGGGVPDPNQQAWNFGLNTLTQVALSGISHIPREGLIPFIHSGYADGVKQSKWHLEESMAHKDGNRLVHLFKHKIADSDPHYGMGGYYLLGGDSAGGLDLGGFGDFLNKLTGKGEELFSYLGGPDSLYGVGRTFHGRYTERV